GATDDARLRALTRAGAARLGDVLVDRAVTVVVEAVALLALRHARAHREVLVDLAVAVVIEVVADLGARRRNADAALTRAADVRARRALHGAIAAGPHT